MVREVTRDGVWSDYRFAYSDDCNWEQTLRDRVGSDPDGMRLGTLTWVSDGAMYRREGCKMKLVAPRPRVGQVPPGDWLATEAEFTDRTVAAGGLVVREPDGPQVVVTAELHSERQVMRFHVETGIPLSLVRYSYLDQPEEVEVERHEAVWLYLYVEGVVIAPPSTPMGAASTTTCTTRPRTASSTRRSRCSTSTRRERSSA